MQSAKHTKGRLRLVVLNEIHLTDMLIELLLLPGFHEIATGIAENLWFYDIDTIYLGLDIFHRSEFWCKDTVKK